MACTIKYTKIGETESKPYTEAEFLALLAEGELDALDKAGILNLSELKDVPPIEPPKEGKEKASKPNEENKKAVYDHFINSDAPKEIKDMMIADGLTYATQKVEFAKEYGKWLLERYSFDEAMKFAEGATKTFLRGHEVDRIAKERDAATSESEKERLTKELFEKANELDEYFRNLGRELQALGNWYLTTESGIRFYMFEKPLKKEVDAVFNPEGATSTESLATKIDDSKKEIETEKRKATTAAADKAAASASRNAPPKRPRVSGDIASKKKAFDDSLGNLRKAFSAFKNIGAIADPEEMAKRQIALNKALLDVAKSYLTYKNAQLSDFIQLVKQELGEAYKDVNATKIYYDAQASLEIEKTTNAITLKSGLETAKEANELEDEIRKQQKKVSELKAKEEIARKEGTEKQLFKIAQAEAAEAVKVENDLREKKRQIAEKVLRGDLTPQQYADYVRTLLIDGTEFTREQEKENFVSDLKEYLKSLGVSNPEKYVDAFVEEREKILRDKARTLIEKLFNGYTDKVNRKVNKRKAQTEVEKLAHAIAYGSLDTEAYRKLFYGRFGLVDTSDPKIDAKLKELSQNILNAENERYRNNALRDAAGYINNLKAKNRLLNYGINYWYNNILATHDTNFKAFRGNLISHISNTLMMAAKDPKNTFLYTGKMWGKNKKDFNGSWALFKASLVDMAHMTEYVDQTNAKVNLFKDYDKGIVKKIGQHFLRTSERLLGGLDMAFSASGANTKLFELVMSEFKTAIKKENERRAVEKLEPIVFTNKEMVAMVNDIFGHTQAGVESAVKAATIDTLRHFKKEKVEDLTYSEKLDLQLNVLYFLNRRIKTNADRFASELNLSNYINHETIDELNERAVKAAQLSVYFGKPKGSLGVLADGLAYITNMLPYGRIFTLAFVNAPLNTVNTLVDASSLGLLRVIKISAPALSAKNRLKGIYGIRGLGQSEEYFKRIGLKRNVSKDELKELWIRVALAQTAKLALIAAFGGFGDDDDDDYTKGTWKNKPFFVTGDLYGNYKMNEVFQNSIEGKGIEKHSVYVFGRKIMQYDDSYLNILFAVPALYMDLVRTGRVKDKGAWEKIALLEQVTAAQILDISSLKGVAKIVENVVKIMEDNGKEGGALSVSQKAKDAAQKSAGNFIANGVVPFGREVQLLSDDVKAVLEMDDKATYNALDYFNNTLVLNDMLRTKTDFFGRPIKENFKVPSPFALSFVRETLDGDFLTIVDKAMGGDKYMSLLHKNKFDISKATIRNATALDVMDKEFAIGEINLDQKQNDIINEERGKALLAFMNKGDNFARLNAISDPDEFSKIVKEVLDSANPMAILKVLGKENAKKVVREQDLTKKAQEKLDKIEDELVEKSKQALEYNLDSDEQFLASKLAKIKNVTKYTEYIKNTYPTQNDQKQALNRMLAIGAITQKYMDEVADRLELKNLGAFERAAKSFKLK